MEMRKKKPCYYCVHNVQTVDYKDVQVLKRFVSSFLKIAQRRRSGLCSKHQRKAALAIKQARTAGLMAYLPR